MSTVAGREITADGPRDASTFVTSFGRSSDKLNSGRAEDYPPADLQLHAPQTSEATAWSTVLSTTTRAPSTTSSLSARAFELTIGRVMVGCGDGSAERSSWP